MTENAAQPPAGESDGALDRYQIAIVRVGGVLVALGGIAGVVAALAVGQPERTLTSLPFAAVGIAVLLLAAFGRIRAATLAIVWGCWFAAANGLLWADGVLSPGATGVFCVVVLLSGWLVGVRTTIALTIASAVVFLAVAYASFRGWPLPRHNVTPPLMVAPLIAIVVLIAGMIGHFAAKSLRTRLEDAIRTERALAEKVRQLSSREVELEALRRRFEVLFRTAPTACVLARPGKGEILDCNEAFCELLGRPREALVGRDSVSLAYWKDLGERARAYEILARDGRLRDFEATFVRPGGEERRCLVAWERVEFGGETQMIAQITDVTRLHRAEQAQRDSEAMLAAAFRASPDALAITRLRDHVIVEANPSWAALIGISREEAIGRDARTLGHWDDFAERERIVRALDAGETVIDVPVKARRRDGTPLECRLSCVRVMLGGEVHSLMVAQDVTAQARAAAALAASERELNEANRRLRLQLSLHELTERLARVGHWVTSPQADRVEWSAALFELCGVPPRGPMSVAESRSLIRIEEREQYEAARQRLDGTPAIYHFRRPDGTIRWVRTSILRAPEGASGEGGFFGVVQDITEAHEATLALERLNAELEQHVTARTAALHAANAELDAFAYSVAHDLSAPLRAIHGFASLLEDEARERLTDDDRGRLDRIKGAATRMAQLIADLLRLSRLTRAPMRLQPVDLTALAREVAAELGATQPGRAVDWRIEEGLTANADPGLARSLLANLLGNAWKYTRDTAQPVIELGRAGDDGHPGEFRIRDNGAGFDMAHAANLFAPFQRLHSPSEFEGNGIGLATVQRIVHRHGGGVRAHAMPGRGATFHFSFSAPPSA